MMTVGVAPGTTTLKLGRYYDPYTDLVQLSQLRDPVFAPTPTFDRPLRWDLIGIVGGGSLVVALTAGLIANAFSRRFAR